MARKFSYHTREPRHPAGAQRLPIETPDPAEMIQLTIVVRPSSKLEAAKRSAVKLAVLHRQNNQSDIPFQERYGVGNESFERIEAFVKASGFQLVDKSIPGRFVIISGKLGELSRTFGIEMCMVENEGIRYRSHRGKVQIPAELREIVDVVLGFDTRPVGRHHGATSVGRPVDPRKVAALYGFPKTLNGSGQCIGIIELGGGFRQEDIRKYFQGYGRPAPQIEVRELTGSADSSGGKGTNDPAEPSEIQKFWDAVVHDKFDIRKPEAILGSAARLQSVLWTIEATMDVELVGTLADGAQIVVYFAPNTEQGKFHAWTAALTDERFKPSVISISSGMFENQLEPYTLRALNDLYHDAVLRGVTICCSSGDTGDGATNGSSPQVNFPASSPFVLACGGTSLKVSRATRKPESVWNEPTSATRLSSGGGVSSLFPTPFWQRGSGVKAKTGRDGRGVPDVAARANLKDGYHIRVGNLDIPMGGTSSAAPLWASLVALLNEKLNRSIGYLNPYLYDDEVRKALLDIRRGRSGKRYQASKGWDACTGLGRPVAQALLDVLSTRISGK
jgi:kumamolisin